VATTGSGMHTSVYTIMAAPSPGASHRRTRVYLGHDTQYDEMSGVPIQPGRLSASARL
jgi:hypothetical protein